MLCLILSLIYICIPFLMPYYIIKYLLSRILCDELRLIDTKKQSSSCIREY
jgi:hypothetical protein